MLGVLVIYVPNNVSTLTTSSSSKKSKIDYLIGYINKLIELYDDDGYDDDDPTVFVNVCI